MKTGFTMSVAAIAAFAALFALAFATQIATYYQIAVVAIFGLFADIIATWLTNAVLMLWYLEGRKEGHK
jgi:preprotein translocase subunit SecF